jgi:hypothetical protein
MNDDFFKRDTNVARIDEDGNVIGTNPDSQTGDSPSLRDTIAENAKGPKKVQGDSGSVEQHSLKDQIEAEKFLQSKKAAQGKGFPVRLFKISPDGTT